MTALLGAGEIAGFHRDGFITPLPALAPAEAAATLAWLDGIERERAALGRRVLRNELLRFKPHLLFTRLDRVIRAPAILDIVGSLIGPDILVWASAFFIKDAGDPAFVSWHQDSATYGLDGDALVTAWIALTEVGPDNAAMQFIPGSHLRGPRRHRDTDGADNMLSRGETVELAFDEASAVPTRLQPGEMSIHHIDLVHGSASNGTGRRRVGYAVRYCAPSMRPKSGMPSALIVRGHDASGRFEHETPPVADEDEAARAAHARAIELRKAAVFG